MTSPSCKDVNEIGLPMHGFGTYQSSLEEAISSIGNAILSGYRHIDTAELYKNEAAVGTLWSSDKVTISRPDLFITTKLWPVKDMKMDENSGKTYEETMQSCLVSLTEMKLEYIDLYLIHAPIAKHTRVEQWKAFIELKKQGKVKHIGTSNYAIHHLKEIEDAGLCMPEVNQLELHPLCQRRELNEYMKRHNILPIAYSSLAPLGTWRAEENQGGSATVTQRQTSDDTIQEIAKRVGKSAAQVLLRWGIQKGFAIIPKSSKMERIQANYDIYDFELGEQDMSILNEMDQNKCFAWPAGMDPLQMP